MSYSRATKRISITMTTESEWNVSTLKQHIERILTEHATAHRAEHEAADGAIKSALLSTEKAIDKADLAVNHRFDSVNEFRALVNDVLKRLELAQAGTLTQREFSTYTDAQDARGRETRLRLEAEKLAAGRQRAVITLGVLVAVFSAAVSVVVAFIK